MLRDSSNLKILLVPRLMASPYRGRISEILLVAALMPSPGRGRISEILLLARLISSPDRGRIREILLGLMACADFGAYSRNPLDWCSKIREIRM